MTGRGLADPPEAVPRAPSPSPVMDTELAMQIVGYGLERFEENPKLVFERGFLEALEVLERTDRATFTDRLSRFPYRTAQELRGEVARLRKQPPINPAPATDSRDELGAIDGDAFLQAFEPPAFVVRPVIVRRQVTAVTAHPNGGKTSISIQFSLLVNGLVKLPGLEADPGRVLYLAGDSDTNFAVQLIGACEQHGIDPARLNDRLVVVPQRFPLAGRVEQIRELAQERGGFNLVVVDTRPAYSSAIEEDDNLQALADALSLRELTRIEGGPAVLVLCHPPKNAARDQLYPRGGSAFLGEIDNNLVLWNDDGIVELGANKRRMPEFDALRWRFEAVDISRADTRGEPVRSVVARMVTDDHGDQRAKVRREDENRLLFTMLRHPDESLGAWARLCGWMLRDGGGEPHKTKVDRTLKRLAADRLVEKYRGRYRLTKLGKREAEGVD
jgi:hypothetical protein